MKKTTHYPLHPETTESFEDEMKRKSREIHDGINTAHSLFIAIGIFLMLLALLILVGIYMYTEKYPQ